MPESLTSYERRVKRLKDNYLEKVTEREKNEEDKKKEKEPQEPDIKITEQNAEPAIELINETDDIDIIMAWLSEESQGKKRKTVIETLEAKIKELED